jgi:hypothetical protein
MNRTCRQLHAVRDRVLVVFGFDHRDRNVRPVEQQLLFWKTFEIR